MAYSHLLKTDTEWEWNKQNEFWVNNFLQSDTEDKLIHALKKNMNDYDLVIINQQITKGLHQNSFPTKLQEVINATNINFISDCRNKEVEYSNTFLKTNIHEAIQKGLFIEGDSDQTIIQKKIDEGFYKKIVISQGSISIKTDILENAALSTFF